MAKHKTAAVPGDLLVTLESGVRVSRCLLETLLDCAYAIDEFTGEIAIVERVVRTRVAHVALSVTPAHSLMMIWHELSDGWRLEMRAEAYEAMDRLIGRVMGAVARKLIDEQTPEQKALADKLVAEWESQNARCH